MTGSQSLREFIRKPAAARWSMLLNPVLFLVGEMPMILQRVTLFTF